MCDRSPPHFFIILLRELDTAFKVLLCNLSKAIKKRSKKGIKLKWRRIPGARIHVSWQRDLTVGPAEGEMEINLQVIPLKLRQACCRKIQIKSFH